MLKTYIPVVTGFKGFTGITGIIGITGCTGFTGITGITGITGVTDMAEEKTMCTLTDTIRIQYQYYPLAKPL